MTETQWIGAVVDTNDGLSIQFGADINSNQPESVIFLMAGSNKGIIESVLKKIINVESDIKNDNVPNSLDSGGNKESYYVYGYFSPRNNESTIDYSKQYSWSDAFYIGKGKANRLYQHITDTQKAFAKQKPLNIKQANILEHIVSDIRQTPSSLRKKYGGALVNKLYNCVADSPEISELMSFAIEYFLISRAASSAETENLTGGNNHAGYYKFLCIPFGFKSDQDYHRELWGQCISTFIENPASERLNHTLRPALLFISKNTLSEKLNESLKKIGLEPFEMKGLPENRIPVDINIENAAVSGASEAMLSFRSKNSKAPVRFDLRISAGDRSTTINLRPLSSRKNDIQKYLNYISSLTISPLNWKSYKIKNVRIEDIYPPHKGFPSIIKNAKNWPFSKPFSWNANGRSAYWFDITEPETKQVCRIDWVEGEYIEVSLLEALTLVNKSWL